MLFMGNEHSSKDNVEIKQPFTEGNYNISIVGKMNSGKSSLLNAILQQKTLLPVKAIRENGHGLR